MVVLTGQSLTLEEMKDVLYRGQKIEAQMRV